MEEEKRPVHSPEHFEEAFKRIVEDEGEKDKLWWIEVGRIGRELKDSTGETVTEGRAQEFKDKMREFMNKKDNFKKYKEALGEQAGLWWEEGVVGQ